MNAARKPRVSEVVFDSSVLIAILQREPFDPIVLDLLEDAVLSTVNLAEVISKQVEIGAFSAPAAERLFASLKRIEPLSAVQGRICGALRGPTRNAGLSLGDRCCLALAIELGAEVYTAERMWAQVDVACKVHLIR